MAEKDEPKKVERPEKPANPNLDATKFNSNPKKIEHRSGERPAVKDQ